DALPICHGGLPPAATGALLNGYGRGDAVDGVHVRFASRLDDRSRVGVQRLQVAALSLVEQDVECQGGLAGTRYAGDDGKRTARDADIHTFKVVFEGIQEVDVSAAGAAAAQDALQRAVVVIVRCRI